MTVDLSRNDGGKSNVWPRWRYGYLMKTTFVDRRGQVWEWLTAPVERCYITRSWLGDHPADGMPITYHSMISLSDGAVVESYIELKPFEALTLPPHPEMKRLL